MLSLAFNAGKLSRIPKLEMLAENNVRENFLEHGSFYDLLSNLPEAVRDLVEFEYLSGWRQGSAKKLEWGDIDIQTWVAYSARKWSEQKCLDAATYGKILEIIQRWMDKGD